MAHTPVPSPAGAPAPDPWAALKAFTAARIALGRTGTSVPLREALAFKLAHAHARDAVYSVLETDRLWAGLTALALSVCHVRSRAATRPEYLQRPDRGRQLAEESRNLLVEQAPAECDLVVVLADGLSATAVNDHALPLLGRLLPLLQPAGFRVGARGSGRAGTGGPRRRNWARAAGPACAGADRGAAGVERPP